MITVFTSTYNRRQTLERLYQSLCGQTSFEFEWLVVDDGSTDDTRDFIESLRPVNFRIRYRYQEHGGKHRAINRGSRLAKGEWFFIVDSDDYITPHAIETLNKYLTGIEGNAVFCGVTALKIDLNGNIIESPCTYTILDTDFISYRTKYKMAGDRAEVIRTSIMRDFPFPEIEGEKFCTEAVVWNRIAQRYLSRYINEKIYVCEYLPEGLSNNYEKIMNESPYCSMIYAKERIGYANMGLGDKVQAVMAYLHYFRLTGYKLIPEVKPPMLFFLLLPLALPACLVRAVARKWFIFK